MADYCEQAIDKTAGSDSQTTAQSLARDAYKPEDSQKQRQPVDGKKDGDSAEAHLPSVQIVDSAPNSSHSTGKGDKAAGKAADAKSGATTGNDGTGTTGTDKGQPPSDQSNAPAKPPEAQAGQTADSAKVAKDVDDIHSALHGMWRSDSDYEKVDNMLKGLNDKERENLKQLYKEKYNIDLDQEFKDHDKDAQQDKALNALNRKDGSGDDAGRIHTALVEQHQLIEGRSNANCEKDIRDTLSTMNSKQIQQTADDYYQRYSPDKNPNATPEEKVKFLHDSLMNDSKVSQATKDTLEIYLKGSDKRTDDDTFKLADQALKNKDIEMFSEAMSNASLEAHKKFMDDGGEQKIKDAFGGHWYNALVMPASPGKGSDVNVTDKELRRAEDVARDGHMSTANKIRENTGVVSNSDKAIEQAIADMRPAERAAYVRGKQLVDDKADESKLSDADKKALQTYKDIHQAIEDTAPVNSANKAKWEDMVVHEGGSLVGRLESHHGTIYNDSTGDTKKEIENMTKEDWEYAKAHPENRAEVLKALEDLKGARVGQDDIDAAMKLYDQKMAAKSYEDSKNVGSRPLLNKLSDDEHWYKNDRKSMVEDITHMTKEEQQKYRTDESYRKQVDDMVKDKLGDGPALDAARHLLDKVAKGQSPDADLIVKMDMRAQENNEAKTMTTVGVVGASTLLMPFAAPIVLSGAIADRSANNGDGLQSMSDSMFGSHSATSIRDMQDEFKKDPALRERILHPQTEEDKKFAADFEKAARQSMGDADYDKYAKPLIETGHLSIEQQMQLDKGAISNDKDGSYKDILNATPEERDKILHDKAYQDKVLGYLSDDDRKVALAVLEQGKEQPEDKIRAKLNHWSGSDDIMSTLREMKDNPAAVQKMEEEYARKYGHSLTADLIDKLSGADKLEAESILKPPPASAREAYNDARDQVYQSYDGVGKAFVNGAWDGTGHMTEDNLNQFSAKMAEFSSKFKELPPEQQKQLSEKLNKSLDQFVESKGAAAGAVVDAVIAIAAVGGAVFTDGVSLSLLAATGAGGAALKVLVNSVIMGSDYDWSAKGVSKDAATGFIDGFVSMLGPGEVGSLLKVGENAAKVATEQALKEGAEQLIKKGGQEVLEKEMQEAVKNAIVHGTYEVSDKTLNKIVEEAAKEGATDADKAALKEALKKALEDNLAKDTKSMLQKLATEYAFNMAGGGLGGGASNLVGATMEWDNSKSVQENMSRIAQATAMGVAFGAAGAAAFTTVFKVGGSMYHGLAESFHLKPGEKLNAQELNQLAKETGIKDAKFHYDKEGNLVLEGQTPDRPAMLPPKPKQLDPHGDPLPQHGTEKPHLDPHSDTIPPTERTAVPDRIPNGEVLKETPELGNLSDAEKAAILERVGKDPMAKPETINDFNHGVKQLMDSPEWQKLSSEEKTTKLQAMLDKFADDHGLPHNKLELIKGEGVGGNYGDGKIGINEGDLTDPAKLIDHLYHESVHSQQDSLVIRNLADQLHIGKEPTAEQIKALQELYKKHTNGELSNEHLGDILKQRDGKPLDATDVARAQHAEQAFRDDPFRSGKMEQIMSDQQPVVKELQPLFRSSENPNASKDLLDKLVRDPEYAKKLFGGEPPENIKKLIDTERRIQNGEQIPFPKEEADTALRDELQKRSQKLQQEWQAGIEAYQKNGNEQEAYLIGRKASLESAHAQVQPHDGQLSTDHPTLPGDDNGPKTERNPETSPNTLRPPNDSNPEIKKTMDLADIPPEERAALADRLNQNDLASPEALKGFAKDSVQLTSSMEDLSSLAKEAKANKEVLKQAQSDFFHKVHDRLVDDLVKGGMPETDAIKLANDPARLRAMTEGDSRVADFFKKNPEDLQTLDKVVHAQAIDRDFNGRLVKRQDEFQQMLDKFNEEHHLPKNKVVLVDAEKLHGAKGQYQNGVIEINANDALGVKDPAGLLETIYHENVHGQQDSLMIRHLTDQFEHMMGNGYKVHEPPTQVELNALRGLYHQKSLGPISNEHLAQVLAARNGEPLTETQSKMAETLMQDWRKKGLENGHEYYENIRFNNTELAKLQQPGSAESLLENLSKDDGKLSKTLFGTKRPPAEVEQLIAQLKHGGPAIDDAKASEILRKAIQHNNDQLTTVRRALVKQYVGNIQETEAFILGGTVRNEVQAEIAAQENPASGQRDTLPQGADTTGGDSSSIGADDQGQRSRRATLPGLQETSTNADAPRDTLPDGSNDMMPITARDNAGKPTKADANVLEFSPIFDDLLAALTA